MTRLLTRISLSLALGLLTPSLAECITLNQIDTFTGNLDNWTDGHLGSNVLNVSTGGPNGAGDGYLQVSSGALGGAQRMITFNRMQWTGNYIAAGVGSVSMELKNFGTTTIPIRITLRDSTGGATDPGYSTLNAFSLPADGQWHLAKFNLTASDLKAINTTTPLSTWLTNVLDFRLLSSTAPATIGDAISARIGVDDITAGPPPPTAWSGASNTSWNNAANWTVSVPGATTGTTSTNTATFNLNATNSPLTTDTGRNLQNITFDTAIVNSLTIGATAGPSLLLTSGGTVQTTSTVANAETVNAPLVLEGNYTFTSGATSSTAALTFGGGITPGPTAGTTTLTLNGSNTGANTIKGNLIDHSTGLLALSKSGNGTWVLSGANNYSGGTTVSAGTLEFDTAPSLANNTTFQVSGGTLRFKVTTAATTVGTGVTVTVANGGTLELAGSASALATTVNRANINNGGTTPIGLLVSGTNQTVGKIDGAGTTQVSTGATLTASHIVQNALLIGGTSINRTTTVTIAASNAAGNPADEIPSAMPAPGLAMSPLSSISLGFVEGIGGEGGISGGSLDSGLINLGSPIAPALSAVPEPSTMLLALAGLAVLSLGARGRFCC